MTTTQNIAKHLREVYTGGNWTSSSLREVLDGVSWQEAAEKVGELNSIVTLVYHLSYYVTAVTRVLEGGALNSSDRESFVHPPLCSKAEWQDLLTRVFVEGSKFASLIEKLPDDILEKDFTDPKYGTYYRNLQGLIEHTHYHLGQIALIKKMLRPGSK